jgi:hypothetical protein
MDCKHEVMLQCNVDYDIPNGEVIRKFCYHCGKVEEEIALEAKLSEAQAEIERLEKVRDAVIKCDDYGLFCAADAYDQEMIDDLREKIAANVKATSFRVNCGIKR